MPDSSSKSRFSPAEVSVVVFTALYMAVWLVASFALRSDEFIFYFAVMCVLIVAVGIVHWQVRLPVPDFRTQPVYVR